ncbi:hypothetical protein PoMZ_10271 [Pyricularia oryzae]|uniref:Uncharacterized protein n=1 Tax=Pyricularia oryzae TaxID=318829 RepID=A0A4P7MWW3_PYROR|nr:hypothetical protein PoMZ_10271 [Pyricularia oryzae]
MAEAETLAASSNAGVMASFSLVGGAAHISCADDAVPVREGKVEQAARVHLLGLDDALGYVVDELVDQFNGLEHRPAQNGWPEPLLRLRARVVSHALQRVEEQGKRPLAVRAAHDAQVPPVCQPLAKPPLDVLPAAKPTVVHPHQAAMVEGVTVVL